MCMVLDEWFAQNAGIMGEDDLPFWSQQSIHHLELFKLAYGHLDNACKPKHHEALHFATMGLRFGSMMATFACERKHQCWKEIAIVTEVVGKFDELVSNTMLNAMAAKMQDTACFSSGTFLCTPHMPFQSEHLADEGFWYSGRTMYHKHVPYTNGDVVKIDLDGCLRAVVLETCLRLDRTEERRYFAIVTMHVKIAEEQWRPESPGLVAFESLRGSCVWSLMDNGNKMVLMPAALA